MEIYLKYTIDSCEGCCQWQFDAYIDYKSELPGPEGLYYTNWYVIFPIQYNNSYAILGMMRDSSEIKGEFLTYSLSPLLIMGATSEYASLLILCS